MDIKFLWNGMKNLKAYIVKKDWILVTASGTIGKLSLVSEYWDNWAATNHLLRVVPDVEEIHPGYLTIFLQSIYGQIQFQRLIYGGVVDEIGEAGELFNNILILQPEDKNIEENIGKLVYQAYSKRDEAIKIENEAVQLLEETFNKKTKEGE